MIEVRDLKKSYATRFGNKVVLDGVNFDLAMGQRLGILGRNGAGKSTMVRLISGAEKPSSGTIDRSMSVSWPLAFGGAFQLQLTGIDNIRFITSIYNQDFDRNLAFVEDFAELGPYLREPVRSYSSGMRARLAFAISMIIEFDCFLIDEIGAVGDARFHDRCNYELFDLRSDRAMMIISHDAGYIREHCNRWAVLHDAKLLQFGDFEHAYEAYKELIGADTRGRAVPVNFSSRAKMIESSQHAALSDERFRAHVQQGDWARDLRNWADASEAYSRALTLYPYQRSYWTQLGHMEKEQGEFACAETAYRTAVALGEPLADVEEHANFVAAQQASQYAVPPLRVPTAAKAADQPPGKPDLEALQWLLQSGVEWSDTDTLAALRQNVTIDELGAAMAVSASFNPCTGSGDPENTAPQLDRALSILGAAMHQPLKKISPDGDLVQQLISAGAFAAWPVTQAALEKRNPDYFTDTTPLKSDRRIH